MIKKPAGLLGKLWHHVFFEIADEGDRKKKAKMLKEVGKDIFDVMRNAIIIATVNVAAEAADSRIIKVITLILLAAFCLHILGAVQERWSWRPANLRRANGLYYIVVIFVAGFLGVGIVVFVKTVENFVVSVSMGKSEASNCRLNPTANPSHP